MTETSHTDNRWLLDRALLERLVSSEKDFREEVLVSLAELKVSFKNMSERFDAHTKDDAEKFGDVTVKLGESTGKLQYILGGAAMAVFLIGVAVAVARLFS